MRMSIVLTCWTALIAGTLASCAGVGPKDIPGVYAMISPYGVEMLRLGADGKYTQVVLLNRDSVPSCHSGTWEFSHDTTEVYLVDGLSVTDIKGQLNPSFPVPSGGRMSTGIITRAGSSVWLRGDVNHAWHIYKRL